MSLPASGGKKIKPPPPPPATDPLSSTCGTGTFVGQHVFPSNYCPDQAHPSRRSLTSSDDAITTEHSFRVARRFILNQRVNVNIEGCGWLLGTVVLLAKAVSSLTGSVVRVRYSKPTERNEREDDFLNHPDYIRPAY